MSDLPAPASENGTHSQAPTGRSQEGLQAQQYRRQSQQPRQQSSDLATHMATAFQAVPGDAAFASSLLFPADVSLAHPQNVQACPHAVKTGVPGVESGSTTGPVTAAGNEPAQQPPTLAFTPVDLSSAHQQAASQLRPAQLYAGAPGSERDNPQEPHETNMTASDIMCDLPAALLARRLGPDVPDDDPAASQHGPLAPPADLEPPVTCHEPNLPPPLSHINWPNTPTASTALRSPGNLPRTPCRNQHASPKVPPQQQPTPTATSPQDQLAPTTPATSPAAPRKQLTSQHKEIAKKRADPARSATSSQDRQAGSSRSAALLKKRPSAQAISSNVATAAIDPETAAFQDEFVAYVAKRPHVAGWLTAAPSSAHSLEAEALAGPAMSQIQGKGVATH